MMHQVNTKDYEEDLCLSLAAIYDEGYPSLPHVHEETFSPPAPPRNCISQECDPTPEECATNDAPLWE